MPVAQLRDPIRNCLNRNRASEELTLQAINRRGQQITCRITFNPLIGFRQECVGVILTMEVVEAEIR